MSHLLGNLVRIDETTRSSVDFRELPLFSYKSLVDEEEIAVVFTAKLRDNSHCT